MRTPISLISVACLAVVLSLMALQAAPAMADEQSFEQSLRVHLKAIVERDLEGLLATVAEQPAPTLIFPSGQLLTGKEAFREVHEQWFADTQWRWEVDEEISRLVTEQMATVVLKYTLRDVPEPGQGNPRSAYLVLVFQHIDGDWLLVHDQNTRIQPPAAGS